MGKKCAFLFLVISLNLVIAKPPVLEDTHQRSIIQPNNLQPIEVVSGTPFYEFSMSVARVEAHGGGFCSSFKVGPDLFMTNWHCSTFMPCNETQFHLGYAPKIPKEEQSQNRCSEILATSDTYDYALYRVDAKSTQLKNYPISTLYNGDLYKDQALIHPSFAGTFTFQIDQSPQCKVVDPIPSIVNKRVSFDHSCDTMGGSSGSPILDRKTGFVVALHWGGAERSSFNQAIRMKDVLADLKIKAPQSYAELQIQN